MPNRPQSAAPRRPSSALPARNVSRPWSASSDTDAVSSRTGTVLGNVNRLPTRPHSSCDPGRGRWENDSFKAEGAAEGDNARNGMYRSSSQLAGGSGIENILEDLSPGHAPARDVRRRFFFRPASTSSSPIEQAGDAGKAAAAAAAAALPTMKHVDVLVRTTDSRTDYLRLYHCDFFGQGSAEGPPFLSDQRTMEVEALSEWLLTVRPRTRFDAFPLWSLTRDLLRRFVSREACLIARGSADRERALADAQALLAASEAARERAEVHAAAARERAEASRGAEEEVAELRRRMGEVERDRDAARVRANLGTRTRAHSHSCSHPQG